MIKPVHANLEVRPVVFSEAYSKERVYWVASCAKGTEGPSLGKAKAASYVSFDPFAK